MLFVTCGFIFTPHLPFSDLPIVQKSVEYAVHGMIGILVLSLIFFALGRYNLMMVGMACVGMLCVFLKNESNNHLILPENDLAPKMTIAHFNLSYVNESYNDFIQRIKGLNVDIISFQELTPDWSKVLHKDLSADYENVLKNVRIDPYGKALFAKNLFLEKDVVVFNEVPHLKATVKIGDKIVNLLSTYILPPLNESSKSDAMEQLDIISEIVKKSRFPSIVFGDLNMVYWSNEIRSFRKECKLENSRRGFTPLGFKIPHDHIFFTPELECSRFIEINDANSNHLGILGTFQFKNIPSEEEIRASIGYLGSK